MNSVVTGDALYVRAYNGTDSRWYRAALRQKAGREPVSGSVNDSIDDAYRSRYRTTVRIVPRDK